MVLRQKLLFDSQLPPVDRRAGIVRTCPQDSAITFADLSTSVRSNFFLADYRDESLKLIERQLACYRPDKNGHIHPGKLMQPGGVQKNGYMTINSLKVFFLRLALNDSYSQISGLTALNTQISIEDAVDLMKSSSEELEREVQPGNGFAEYILANRDAVMQALIERQIDPSAGGKFREDAAKNIYQAMVNMRALGRQVSDRAQSTNTVAAHGRPPQHERNMSEARRALLDFGQGHDWTLD